MSRHRHGRGRAGRRSSTVQRERATRRTAVQTKARTCTGKRAFATAAKAMRDIDHKVRMGDCRDGLNHYTCRFCGLIHTGHRPGYRRENR